MCTSLTGSLSVRSSPDIKSFQQFRVKRLLPYPQPRALFSVGMMVSFRYEAPRSLAGPIYQE